MSTANIIIKVIVGNIISEEGAGVVCYLADNQQLNVDLVISGES